MPAARSSSISTSSRSRQAPFKLNQLVDELEVERFLVKTAPKPPRT